MAKFRNVDIGVVQDVNPIYVRRFASIEQRGVIGNIQQNLEIEPSNIQVLGYLNSATQAQQEALRSLIDGQVGLLDLSSEGYNPLGWGVIERNPFRWKEKDPLSTDYSMNVLRVPCIGTTEIMGDYGRVSDINYMRKVRMMDPFRAYCNVQIGSNGLEVTHQFYVINVDTSSARTIELCIWAGDDVSKIDIWAWKGGAWDFAHSWGTGGDDAWAGTEAFTDDDSVVHTFRVNKDERGDTPTSFTNAIPWSLGNMRRVAIQISGMSSLGANTPVYNKYGEWQLYLKVKLTHTYRDAVRQYPIITYETGGYGDGPI